MCVISNICQHLNVSLSKQAAIAGKELKELIGNESVYFIVSPYTRTRMTYEIVKEALGQDRMFAVKEDPRLRGAVQTHERGNLL